MRILFAIFLFFSNLAYACEMKVPIEVSFEFGKKPTETEVGYLRILAPIKYNGWSINGVQFFKGENMIPIMKYESKEEFPGKALFELTATLEFLRGTKLMAYYTQDPVIHNDGSITGSLCAHAQEIEIKI